jgi:transposase
MAIALRPDFDAARVRRAARDSSDANQVRRLLALAAIYASASRSDAAAMGGVTLQVVRDWVLKFNAAGLAGLIDRKAPGQRSRLKAKHRAALVAVLERGHDPAGSTLADHRSVPMGMARVCDCDLAARFTTGHACMDAFPRWAL